MYKRGENCYLLPAIWAIDRRIQTRLQDNSLRSPSQWSHEHYNKRWRKPSSESAILVIMKMAMRSHLYKRSQSNGSWLCQGLTTAPYINDSRQLEWSHLQLAPTPSDLKLLHLISPLSLNFLTDQSQEKVTRCKYFHFPTVRHNPFIIILSIIHVII